MNHHLYFSKTNVLIVEIKTKVLLKLTDMNLE